MGSVSPKLLESWLKSGNNVHLQLGFDKDAGVFTLKTRVFSMTIDTLQVLNTVDSFADLLDSVEKDGDKCIIRLNKFNKVRDFLINCNNSMSEKKHLVNIQIPPNISRINVVDMPPKFRILYQWNQEGQFFNKKLVWAKKQTGDCIFSRDDEIWGFDLKDKRCNFLVGNPRIEAPDVTELLNKVIPRADAMFGMGNIISCDVELSDIPAYNISLKIENNMYILRLKDNTGGKARTHLSKNEDVFYIFHRSILYPYSRIYDFNFKSEILKLSYEEFVDFVLENNHLDLFFDKELKKVISELQFVSPDDIRLKMVAVTESENGIGSTKAVPAVVIGKTRFKAAEISALTNGNPAFIKLGENYVRVKDLRNIGIGQCGRFSNGAKLSEREASLRNIITGIYSDSNEPFDGFIAETDKLWISKGTDAEIAAGHLRFLLHYGINGGIVQEKNRLSIIKDFIVERHREFPRAKTLLLLKKDEISKFKNLFEKEASEVKNIVNFIDSDGELNFSTDNLLGNNSPCSNIFVVAYSKYEKLGTVREAQWDLALFHDFENSLKSPNSKLFSLIAEIKTRIKLCAIGTMYSRLSRNQREAIDKVFNIDGQIQPYVLRRTNMTLNLLRDRQVECDYVLTADVLKKEIMEMKKKNLPVRIRYYVDEDRPYWSSNSYKFDYEPFVKSARALNKKNPKEVPYVQFYNYYPSVDRMSAAQREWYAYFRDQVKKGNYVKTSDSYLAVLAYEIINGTLGLNRIEEYQLFLNVYNNYPIADTEIGIKYKRWITDFIILNFNKSLDIGKLSISCDLKGLTENIQLEQMIAEDEFKITHEALGLLCTYKYENSKFYMQDNTDEMAQCYFKVLYEIDKYYREKYRAGILEMHIPFDEGKYNKELFAHAIVKEVLFFEITVTKFTENIALKEFITSIIKYTENLLRRIKKYPGKLKYNELDDDIRYIIDSTVGRIFNLDVSDSSVFSFAESNIRHEKRNVEIDVAALDKHRDDAEILTKLLAVEGSFEEEKPKKAKNPKPVKIQEEPQADAESKNAKNSGIAGFISSLSELQLEIIRTVAKGGDVRENLDKIGKAHLIMPEMLIDEINSLFMDSIGDLLIDGFDLSEEYFDEIKKAF